MRPLRIAPPSPKTKRGFAIVSAIFLLVILAGLGVAMLVFSNNQQAASAYDVQGSRAYQAARAGIEWALYRRLNGGVFQNANPTPSYCASNGAVTQPAFTQSIAMPSNSTLAPFTVTITCTPTQPANINRTDPVSGQPTTLVIRTIQAVACNQPVSGNCPGTGGLDYVQRKLSVTLQQTN